MYDNTKQLVRMLDSNDSSLISLNLFLIRDRYEFKEVLFFIRKSVVVKKLKMHLGHFDDSGSIVSEIAMLLISNKNLRFLDLSGCKISDNEAITIAAGLSKNHSLISLNLSNNQIGAIGLEAILCALPNTDVTHIDLLDNAFGADESKKIDFLIGNTRNNLSVALYRYKDYDVSVLLNTRAQLANTLCINWAKYRASGDKQRELYFDQIVLYKSFLPAIAFILYRQEPRLAMEFERDINRLYYSIAHGISTVIYDNVNEMAKL